MRFSINQIGFVDNQKHDGTLNELWKLLIVLLKDQVENQVCFV